MQVHLKTNGKMVVVQLALEATFPLTVVRIRDFVELPQYLLSDCNDHRVVAFQVLPTVNVPLVHWASVSLERIRLVDDRPSCPLQLAFRLRIEVDPNGISAQRISDLTIPRVL